MPLAACIAAVTTQIGLVTTMLFLPRMLSKHASRRDELKLIRPCYNGAPAEAMYCAGHVVMLQACEMGSVAKLGTAILPRRTHLQK